MIRIILFLVIPGFTGLVSVAQNQYTPYDNLPGIDKIYKPVYDPSFSGWKKMLYDYPVNYQEITSDFNLYINQHKNEKSAIIRYYKIWSRAVEPYTNYSGEIEIPNLENILRNKYLSQTQADSAEKSATFTNSNWTFLGPKETFWLNEGDLSEDRIGENGEPEQCPWQVNVYSFDVSNANNNILYCGTETGYVNKSVDKGLNWIQLGKNYPFGGAVSAIAIHPNNSDIVYVSAGKQIHKTINGGQTWSPLLALNKTFDAVRLKINPENAENIIAASNNGLYVSNDAGNSWTKRWSNPVWDVEFKPADPSVIYGLSKNSSGKFQAVISKNNGDSFLADAEFPNTYTETSGGLLAVTPSNQNIIYATLLAKEGEENVPFILKGTEKDGKLNWEEIKKGEYQSTGGLGGFTNGQGYFDLVLEVSPNDENLVFWGTCSLYKSTDGGINYTKIGGYGGDFPIHPDIQDMKILSNGEMWVSTDGGMNFSTDFFTDTKNYTSRTKGIIGSDMWGFDQGWNEDIIVGGRYHNGNTALADFYGDKSLRMGGGESETGWVLQGKSRHVVFNDLGNGWILPKTAEEKQEGRFIFSKYPNMDEYGGRRSNLIHHPNYYGTIFLGEGNGFWKSTDIGVTFDLLYQFPDRVRYLQISYKNPDVFYADIVNKGFYKSEDGGKTWTHKPALTDGRVGDSSWNGKLFFAVSPYDENRVYVCWQNGTWYPEKGKIYYTENGGDTWHDWTDGISEYTKCMVIQPTGSGKDLVYLFTNSTDGNPSKVYSRIEGQPYWNNFDTGYPAGLTVNLALPFFRDAKIRVAGNSGVWESYLADTVFTPIINPWIEKSYYDCMEDTLYFDDHSILNHNGASWNWEITPNPVYIDDVNSRNPKVVLGNPGYYDVTLTVHQNGETYSKTITDMVSTTTCPSVNDCSNPAEIDKANWSLVFVDSEEKTGEDGKAINAFDGNPDSFWHTEWYYNKPSQPHEIQIDLGRDFLLSSFIYLPRQSSSNGRIKDYEFYISDDLSHWGNAISKGVFESGASPTTLSFEPVNGRYIRFKSLSELTGNPFTTVGEISLIGCVEKGTAASDVFDIEGINAYPIPAHDKITVQLPVENLNEKWNYQIVSSSGQIIQNKEITVSGSDYTFYVNNLNPGMYFILLQNKTQKSFRIKIIIN